VSVLNATVTDGWLPGARANEQRPLVGFDPLTSVGVVRLTAASAD